MKLTPLKTITIIQPILEEAHLEHILIRYFIAGPFEVMTYLLADLESGEAVVIDPAGRLEEIKQIVESNSLEVKLVVATHGHVDHILELKGFQSAFGSKAAMHDLDHRLLKEGYDSLFGDISEFKELAINHYLEDNQIIYLGKHPIKVLHTPGHTPGSVCLLIENNIFTGDTLFVGAVGRTDLKGGSFETLLDSIKRKILPLPDETIVWPGHDYGDTPTSTIGRERQENPYITDFLL